MKKILIFTLLVVTSLSVKTQHMDITWQQCLTNVRDGSYYYDICNFNNGFLITADIHAYTSDSIRNLDIWLAYIDSTGNQIWEKTIGGSAGDVPSLIIPIDNEFFYLIGYSSSSDGDITCDLNAEYGDSWIAKLNKNGEIIWQTCYGCTGFDDPRAAIVTPDDGLLLNIRIFEGGGDVGEYYGMYDNWIVKLDSTGVIEWETTLGSPERDNGLKLLYTSFNTYIALCAVGGNGGVSECTLMNDPSMGKDVWLVELDLDGNIINQECFGGSLHDLSWDIVETDVGYTILSKTESNDYDVSGNHGGEWDFWLLGINFNRDVLWQKCLGGSSYDTPKFLTLNDDGTYIVIGDTDSHDGDVSGNHSNGNLPDIWVVNTDSIGNVIWQQCIGAKGMEWFFAGNTITKKNDHTFTMISMTTGPDDYDGDVECEDWPTTGTFYPWVFQIKDCSQYQPTTPLKPTGKDYLCVNTDSITTYTTQIANGAWYYEWELVPDEAGTIVIDSITAQTHWSPTYEGQATIKVRSDNDCGTSAWSDSLIIQTYICLGTEENNTNSNFLSVYPNPASSTLTVSYNKPIYNKPITIDLLDVYGKIVFKQNMKGQKQKTVLDISKLAAGLYFVRVIEDGILIGVKKVVVE